MNSQLDRETKDFYSLVIQAVDGGVQPRSGVLTLNITVEDDNDNPPVFEHSQYNVSVNETLAPRSVITSVLASDRDIGFNGEVGARAPIGFLSFFRNTYKHTHRGNSG